MEKIDFIVFNKLSYQQNTAGFLKDWLSICVCEDIGRYKSDKKLFEQLNIVYSWNFEKDNDLLPLNIWMTLGSKIKEKLNLNNYNYFKKGFDNFFLFNDEEDNYFYKGTIDKFYLILYVDNEPVAESGFVILENKTAIIHGIETKPSQRGKGYAFMVLEQGKNILLQRGIKKLKSKIAIDNFASKALHKKAGFFKVSVDGANETFEFFK